jgi:acetyltransferase-like isoleucine patch superfamily enzyme
MRLSRKILEYIFMKIRGNRIDFDNSIATSILIKIALQRVIWFMRGLLRVAVFKRQLGYVFMGNNVEILNYNRISFGKGVILDSHVYIDALSQHGVKIGDSVSLGRYTTIRCTGSLSKLGVGVEIGNGTSIGSYAYLGAAGGIRVGCNVIMGTNVSFLAENHRADDIHKLIKLQGTTTKGISIGNDCWIGSNVVFLDGSIVGSGCIIGAGAVVNGHVPDLAVAVGVPARIVRFRE